MSDDSMKFDIDATHYAGCLAIYTAQRNYRR
jgi:hypothetical protein